jgi:uncharacterized SAM-binding protein YcdF (DUF218 family)
VPWLRRVLGLGFAVLVLWLAGFGYFIAAGLLFHDDPAVETDAIVVLTGGRQRLEAGLDLLVAGRARKLFISGVNQRVDREELLRVLGPAAERSACCIVLGHEAETTAGNARETANWMSGEGYNSLRLVTSWYHLPRSLLEFRRTMPDLTIVAHPVFVQHAGTESWSSWHGAPLLVLVEYHKYLAAWVRPLVPAGALSPANEQASR